MKNVFVILSREFRSLFSSPVAYIVLSLFALLTALFFVVNVISFQAYYLQLAQANQLAQLAKFNLNDELLMPFFGSMWLVLLLLIPGITMGLFTSDKANSTEELLLTSPIGIWEIVLGKYLAAAAFVGLFVVILAVFPVILFVLGAGTEGATPELGKTLSGLLGLFLTGLGYAAVGAFASSVTRHQIIAFFAALVLLFVIALFSFFGQMAEMGGTFGEHDWIANGLNYVATVEHLDRMLRGLIDTTDLTYFGVMIAAFLVMTKAAVESVRWR